MDILPREIKAWADSASANVNGFGIHKSQFEALKIMMSELFKKTENSLTDLAAQTSNEQFADKYLSLSEELIAVHDLWRIFRYIFTQREDDSNFKSNADAADLIAADCYLTCMRKARDWGLVQEAQFREPPLTYLEANISPSTAGRGKAVEALGIPIRQYRNLRLPIPIVILPFDQANSIWMFCNLHHEVGHNLEQDLNLMNSITGPLLTRMTGAGIPMDRQKMWRQWGREILADVFGILLGERGFAFALCNWLLALAPAAQFKELDAQDVHPPFYIRIRLIANLLRKTGVALLNDAADTIDGEWDKHAKPNWALPFITDSEVIADIFLHEKLAALGGRDLSAFNPNLANDVGLNDTLANCLPNNFHCPDPAIHNIPHRSVPAAAQLAVMGINNPSAADLDAIQKNALGYLKRIARPTFLSGTGRADFIRGLSGSIDLTLLKEKAPDV